MILIFFISIFHSSSIRDCLLKEKQYFTQRLHKPKKLPVPWLFHVKIINRILRSSTFLSTQGTSSPSDWLEHFLLCIAGCCFLMPINATCCYKNVFKKKMFKKKSFKTGDLWKEHFLIRLCMTVRWHSFLIQNLQLVCSRAPSDFGLSQTVNWKSPAL